MVFYGGVVFTYREPRHLVDISTVSILAPQLDLVKLRELRIEKKFSLSQLAKELGRAESFIYDQLRKSGIEKAKANAASTPFGWNRSGTKLIKNAKEQKVLCEITKLHEQKFGNKKIAKHLNDQKMPTRFGGKWWPYTVSRVRSRLK